MDNGLIVYLLVFASVLSITILIERRLIPFLAKRAAQPIYAEGPSWHMSNTGTPTMGGLAFLVSISTTLGIVCIFLFSQWNDFQVGISLLISMLYSIGNALIGVFDDLMKLRKKQNAGLTPIQKLALQSLLAVLFLMARKHFFDDPTILNFSFGSIDIGFIYYPFALILLLGVVNCANLTDGVDGLASTVAICIGSVFVIIGAMTSLSDVSILSVALIGGAVGFLHYNKHPAKIFMGDTGSLFLGALAACLAFSSANPLTIILIGGVYVVEGVSVILQVLYFKLTKKRLFKMAPFHHHLEKCGFTENKICLLFAMISLALSLISFAIFKI